MPVITLANLVIMTGNPGHSNVTVHAQIKFTAAEVEAMKKKTTSYRIGCKLYAQDSQDVPPGPNKELKGGDLGWKSYPGQSAPTQFLNHTYFRPDIANTVLNEDPAPNAKDELFARIVVIATASGQTVATQDSNLVTKFF